MFKILKDVPICNIYAQIVHKFKNVPFLKKNSHSKLVRVCKKLFPIFKKKSEIQKRMFMFCFSFTNSKIVYIF